MLSYNVANIIYKKNINVQVQKKIEQTQMENIVVRFFSVWYELMLSSSGGEWESGGRDGMNYNDIATLGNMCFCIRF